MSVSDRQENRRGSKRPERARDFIVLTLGGAGLLALLMASGALGPVEGLMAVVVLFAGAMAYFVGSIPPEPAREIRTTEQVSATPSETPIKALIRALPFPAFYINAEKRIEIANQRVHEIFRVPNPEGALKSVVIRQPDLLSATDRVAMTGAGERVEFIFGEADELWLAHLTPGPDQHSVFVVLEDRTAVHRAERARADFLANASHELRTPLTALAGFIETMRGPARNDRDSWDGFLEIMHQQTDRMRHLVSDLLSLSRIEFSEHRAPDTVIDLSEVLKETILSLQPIAAERSIQLDLSGSDKEIPITAKWDEIAQVVQNLVSNALKYSPEGSRVLVTTGMASAMTDGARLAQGDRPGASRAVLLQPRASTEVPAAWLSVQDEGHGISRQHLSRLGERFYRVDESRSASIEGTGLGLAIVKHIMARHRGGLVVASKEDEGATFGVWLPKAEAEDNWQAD